MKKASRRKMYIETWWGENIPDYLGMEIELRVIKPRRIGNAVTTEMVKWMNARFTERESAIMVRIPVYSTADLDIIAELIKKRLSKRGWDVECRVKENGIIDVYRTGGRKYVRISNKPRDRWSVYIKR